MNIGDLYWVEFPTRGGHAQAGRRPAIIAQAAARYQEIAAHLTGEKV